MRIVAVTNQKGGVGKTTTALNLGAALCELGYRILLVDLDPQGNASTGLDIPLGDRSPGSYALLAGQALPPACVRTTLTPRLSIIASEPDLAAAEIELVDQPSRERQLAGRLHGVSGYDAVIIDCPPSLGLLTINALVAANSVLVPLQCEFFALEGLSQLAQTVDRVRSGLNPGVDIDGILLTMYDRRNNLSELVASDARRFFGARVFDTVIPRNVRISEAPSHGMPVIAYDPKSAGAAAYMSAAREFARRQQLHAIEGEVV